MSTNELDKKNRFVSDIHDKENIRFELPGRRAVLPRFMPDAMKPNMPLVRLIEEWARRISMGSFPQA